MKVSAGDVANGAACCAFAAIIAAAVVVADVLSFLGLFLIGALIWLICVRASMSQDTPTWGPRTFEAQMTPERSPEQRAARRVERETGLAPYRFFGRCGMALTLIGAVGFIWQTWLAAPSNGH